MISKATAVNQALQSGRVITRTLSTGDLDVIAIPDRIQLKWAGYPGNNSHKLSRKCFIQLKEFYDIRKASK